MWSEEKIDICELVWFDNVAKNEIYNTKCKRFIEYVTAKRGFHGMHTELEARGTYRNRDTYTQNILEILVHTVHILTIAFFSSSQIYRQADLVYCDIVPQNMQNIFCACFFFVVVDFYALSMSLCVFGTNATTSLY